MTADITGHTTPRPSGIKRNEMEKRIEKLEERTKELKIMVNCLRKQMLDMGGKKSYTEQAREYAAMREQEEPNPYHGTHSEE